jgi:transcription initiation factor TFIID TATA-box-binding protein
MFIFLYKMWKVTNMVVCGKFNIDWEISPKHFAAEELVMFGTDLKYDPGRFPGIIIKLPESGVTCLLFLNGKVNLLGIKTEDHAAEAILEVQDMIARHGIEVSVDQFDVKNYCGSTNLGYRLDLNGFSNDNALLCVYNPEDHHNLIYRPLGKSPCITLCYTGNLYVTGCKSVFQMEEIFNELKNKLLYYKKDFIKI